MAESGKRTVRHANGATDQVLRVVTWMRLSMILAIFIGLRPLARGRPRRRSVCTSATAMWAASAAPSGCGVCAERIDKLGIWSFWSAGVCSRFVPMHQDKAQASLHTPKVGARHASPLHYGGHR